MDAFLDRRDAGIRLSRALVPAGYRDVVVLGLPRGGVIVAAEVARVLNAPLDVIVVRKLGLPIAPEVAMGAIAEGGIRYVDEEIVARNGVRPGELARVERAERRVLERRAAALRGSEEGDGRRRLPEPLDGCTAIVVDDGVATGATARVACRAARARGARTVVLAVPVGAPEALAALAAFPASASTPESAAAALAPGYPAPADSTPAHSDAGRPGPAHPTPDADVVFSLAAPDPFGAVGRFYADFRPTTDAEVAAALAPR